MKHWILTLLLAVYFSNSELVVGQCAFDFLPGSGVPGVDGIVYAMTTWDPDAVGPMPDVLVIGGVFRIAGDAPTVNAAAWDGVRWTAMGQGLEDQEVRALISIDGDLFAAGSPSLTSQSSRIMKWDIDKWQTVGNATRGTSWATTNALAEFKGDLIVGGLFSEISGVSANSIARWDGKSWHALGFGVGGHQPQIFALGIYDGELIAGGQFQTAGGETAKDVAAWNGSGWRSLNPVVSVWGEIYSVCEHNGELIVGGRFADIGGVAANNAARWNGDVWSPLDDGLTHPVMALTNFAGRLVAGGGFHGSGNTPARGIASWDGTSWGALDIGIGTQSPARGALALANFRGELVAAGLFNRAGGAYATSIAAWNGSSWRSIGGGLLATVFDWNVFKERLVVASTVNSPFFPYGAFVGAWNGDGAWDPIALRISGDVNRLVVFDGELVVGGTFSSIDDFAAAKIARWNGEEWSQLGSGITQNPAAIYAMQEYLGDLIVAGGFSSAGGVSASNIGRWDGTNWSALGSGLNGSVFEMIKFEGELIVAGSFSSAGGVPAQRLAKWNGDAWSALNTPFNVNGASALAVYNKNLIVGGSFGGIGESGSTSVVLWNGKTWLPVGDELPGEGVREIAVYDDQIFVGGTFHSIGGQDHASAARWDGSNWQPVGDWFGGPVLAMKTWNGEFFMGGDFPAPYEGTSAYYYFARLAPTCALGDMNCDDAVDLADVGPFIEALLAPEAQDDCTLHTANVNGDIFDDGASKVDGGDVGPFVAAVLGW